MAKWKLLLLPFLAKFGIFGVGAVALLDSSTIPVPMDLILAGYVWADKGHFWVYCLLAAVAAALWAGPGRRRILPAETGQPKAVRADAHAL